MRKTLVLALLWVAIIAASAAASEWHFYGSARMGAWSIEQNPQWTTNPLTNADNRSTSFAQQTNSRIGARVAAGDISGHVEYGLTSAGAARLRLLWGRWQFGKTALLVGQSYPPSYFAYSNQVAASDNDLLNYGLPSLRVPMIEIKHGPLKVAAIQPAAGYATDATYANIRTVVPKLEASWEDTLGPVLVHVSGGYNAVSLFSANDRSLTAVSYVMATMVKYTTGSLTTAASVTYGLNGNEYGDGRFDGVDAAGVISGNDYRNNTAWGVDAVASYKFSDRWAAEIGYGYVEARRDDWTDSDGARSFYFQIPVTLADGVTITPEFTVFDKMDDETNTPEGTETWIGAKFQINF